MNKLKITMHYSAMQIESRLHYGIRAGSYPVAVLPQVLVVRSWIEPGQASFLVPNNRKNSQAADRVATSASSAVGRAKAA